MWAKAAVIIVLLGALGAAGWSTKLYFEAKAERDQVVDSFEVYAENVQHEAIEQNKLLDTVRATYQEARDDAARRLADLERHDLAALAREKPDALARSINNGFDGLFAELESATSGDSAAPGKDATARTRQPALPTPAVGVGR